MRREKTSSSLDAKTYWQESADPLGPFPIYGGEGGFDIVIVGAGFSGLSAALALAKKGFKVAVFEAERVGFGSSGRNGGHICTGYAADMGVFSTFSTPEQVRHYFEISEEAKKLLLETISVHNITCDLTMGYLTCALRQSHNKTLEALHALYERFGYFESSLLSKKTLENRLQTTCYAGALFDRHAGHFHPMKYLLGLARAAVALGVKIFEHSPVVGFSSNPLVIETTFGSLKPNFLLLACGPYTGELVQDLARHVVPAASYVIATAPLGETLARTLIPGDEAVTDTRFVMDYFRRTADHRLVFGGRCSYSGWHPHNLTTGLLPRMLKIFPQLKGVKIDFAWGGYVDITRYRLPYIGKIGNSIYYLHGLSGQGVVLSGFLGNVLASVIAGEASSFEMFSRIPHHCFPGGKRLKRVALTLGMMYYRIRDLLF